MSLGNRIQAPPRKITLPQSSLMRITGQDPVMATTIQSIPQTQPGGFNRQFKGRWNSIDFNHNMTSPANSITKSKGPMRVIKNEQIKTPGTTTRTQANYRRQQSEATNRGRSTQPNSSRQHTDSSVRGGSVRGRARGTSQSSVRHRSQTPRARKGSFSYKSFSAAATPKSLTKVNFFDDSADLSPISAITSTTHTRQNYPELKAATLLSSPTASYTRQTQIESMSSTLSPATTFSNTRTETIPEVMSSQKSPRPVQTRRRKLNNLSRDFTLGKTSISKVDAVQKNAIIDEVESMLANWKA